MCMKKNYKKIIKIFIKNRFIGKFKNVTFEF